MDVPIGEFILGAAVESAPAAGAEIKQVIIGGAAVTLWITFAMVLGLLHRAGRTSLLDRTGALLERRTGIPGWTVLPYLIAVTALAVAGVGFVWDVALHLDSGRDAGPFANPSHYMLIVGTVGFVTAGWFAVAMPKGREAGPSAVRVAHDWYAPAGGVAMLACGLMSLSGFAADDVWHRLFGQDVTLWGPTHLMMITGGLLVLFSAFVLMREGMRTKRPPRTREEKKRAHLTGESTKGPVAWISTALLLGGALAGMTIAYQQEFSYGFPQFRLLFHPLLIAFSAGVVLTAARTLYGRGGALLATGGALVINALLALIVTEGFGEITLHFPLYIAAGLLVELAALVALGRGRYWFAALSAFLIGALGTVAEYGWTQVWMPIEWPAHILPSAIALAIVAAGCGAVLGTFFGTTLTAQSDSPLLARGSAALPIGAIAVFTVMVVALIPANAPDGVTAKVTTEQVSNSPREVIATVTYSDPTIGDDADWILGFAWQGDAHARLAPLVKVGPGTWRTTEPLPVEGTWKAALRIHRGSMMASVPLYMPADSALGLAATPAPREFTRAVAMDRKLMQRERRDDVPGYLFALGASIVALMTIALVLLLGWALLRVARGGPASAGVAQAAGDSVDGQQAESSEQFPAGLGGAPAA